MKELRHLNKYFRKYRSKLLLGFLFIVLSNIANVMTPGVIRGAIDTVVNDIDIFRQLEPARDLAEQKSALLKSILFFSMLYLGLSLLQGAFMFLTRQTIIVMSRLIEFDLKNEIYSHYQRLDAAFYKRNNTGDLMSRITEDVNRVRMYLGPAVMYSLNLVVLVVLVISFMISVNPRMTMYVLLPLPILSISIYLVSSVINRQSERIQKKLSDLTTNAQETYSGMRVIKAYVQEKYMYGFFEGESERYKTRALKLAKTEALFFPLILLLIGTSNVFTVYIGGIEVINGRITPGNIAEFIIYVNMLTWPVTSLGWIASLTQRAAASQKRINEFLKTKPTINDRNDEPFKMKGTVEFKNVTFRYPDTGILALENLNFKIRAGERWAIVGKTGCGKSTVAELLLRMYEPDQGEICFDGTDLRELNLRSLREQIGYVPQDVFLFSETIANNILFGMSEVEGGDVRQAAEDASIAKEIESFPKGFETIVGERGVTLSGGQKQRSSIARALIKDPKLLILDDALSAVDAHTEQTILGKLRKHLTGRTSIIITHRIFSVLDFHGILVLKDGKIHESGTHDELLELNGLYRSMYEKQMSEEQVQQENQLN